MHDLASVCEECEAWAAALVDPAPLNADAASPSAEPAAAARIAEPLAAAPAPVAAPAPAAAPTPVAASAPAAEHVARRREMMLAAVAIAGVAVVALWLLFGRGVPASEVSAAAPAAAAAAKAPSAVEAPARPATQAWSTDNQAHWLGNRRGAAFELPAENIVQTWFGPMRPSLVVRCLARSTQVFVYTGSPMKIEPRADGKTVTVSVDGEPMRTERWPDSDDHDALFAPDGAAFAQRLLQARTLRVGYSPHNHSDVVAEFSVNGIASLMGPAAKECGWTK